MREAQARATGNGGLMGTTPGRVHLYTAILDQVDDAEARSLCEAILSLEERARCERFMFERSRREFLYGHALVRLALSQHAPGVAPEAWTISVGAHGRPEVAGPLEAPGWHFNLSHTDGLVACVVGREPLVGVDAEATHRPGAATEIADRFFAPPEVEALRRLPPSEQRDRFFRYWTLKESYLKARGLGLALPLDQFWFDLSPGGEATIEFGGGIVDTPSRWRFAERRPTPRHRLAVALGTEHGGAWTMDLAEEPVNRLGL